MPTQYYELLNVRRGAGGRPEWSGFMAHQGVDIPTKFPPVARLGRVLTALQRHRELRLLGLEMTADETTGQLDARARGLLAPLVNKPLRKVLGKLNQLGAPLTLRSGGFVYNLYQPPVPSTRMVNHLAREFVRGRRPVWPSSCTLQVTARCQLDCYHCSAARFTNRSRQELSTAEWQEVIRQAMDLGIFNIVFTGGEPLLRPDICELIAAVDQERAQPMLFSNGLLLSEDMVKRLRRAGLYAVNVSLDDPRPEIHNRLRRAPQGFEQATEGIRRALDGGLLVGISTYAGPAAVRAGLVEQMIELARDLGVHEVTVFDIVPTGKLLPLEENGLLSAADKQHLVAMERDYNSRPDYPHIITQAHVNGPEGAGCFGGFSQFYMTAYGDVDPCDFTPLTFGNIRDESLEAIWRRMLSHDAYRERCSHCRMQDADFRRQYIDHIPAGALLPWPACEELQNRPHGPQTVSAPAVAGGIPSACACAGCPGSPATHEERQEQVPQTD